MAPHSRCFTVATLARPPNDDVRRQWKKHLNRRRFSIRGVQDRDATFSQLYPGRGDPRSLKPDQQHHYISSNTPATSPCIQNCADPIQGISTSPVDGSARGATGRVSLSPAVGTLFKASWPSSDSSSETSSPSVSPRRGEVHLAADSDYRPGDVQRRNQPSGSTPPRAQSVVTVVTPRKVRFLIERIDPEKVAASSGGGPATPRSGGSQSPDPPNSLHTPLPRITACLPIPSDNNLVATPEALASTSSNTSFVAAPTFNSVLFSSTPPRDTSQVSDDPIRHTPPPHISSLPSSSGLAPVDNTPRPPPSTLVPAFVVHRFRAGEQDGYTRSFKTSASFPLSRPPVGEWQLGDVFLHEHDQTGSVQIWIWDSEWVVSREYDPHPSLPDRYLCFRSKLEPSWVKGQTVRSYKSRRRQKEGQLLARGKARA